MNEQDKTIRELCELNSIYQYEYIKDKRSCKSVREYRGILMRPVSVCEKREKEIKNNANGIIQDKTNKIVELHEAIKQEREHNKEALRVMCFNSFIAGKNDVKEQQFKEYFEVMYKDYLLNSQSSSKEVKNGTKNIN